MLYLFGRDAEKQPSDLLKKRSKHVGDVFSVQMQNVVSELVYVNALINDGERIS